MEEDRDSLCRICNEYRADIHHDSSLNHRFHFLKWAYTHYRKPLISDRHGATLKVEANKINNFHFDFRYVKGKYVLKMTSDQLQRHNSTISLRCVIKNIRKEPLFILSTDLLHPSSYFAIEPPSEENLFIKLHPGGKHEFTIKFSINDLSCASYKIPFSCDLQTDENAEKAKRFSIVRAFLVEIYDEIETEAEKNKSPFTRKEWKEVKKVIPCLKETKYTDSYKIPKEYLKMLKWGLQRSPGMKPEEENDLRKLSQTVRTLTKDNYAFFWHILLWMEEIEQSIMLLKYNMQGVTVDLTDDDKLILEVPGLAEKRPSVIMGDFVKLRLTGDLTAYVGFVDKVNDKTVEISHVDDELTEYLKQYPKDILDVSFLLNRLSFERMHHAVDHLVKNRKVEKLFPSQIRHYASGNCSLTDKDFLNTAISRNEEQKKAVIHIINCTHDLPYIVFGPPGTGKTITIVEAILQLKKRTKKRILVCAPANAACDMLTCKLMERCTPEELIRIHSGTREMTTLTEKLKKYSNMEDDEIITIEKEKLLSYRIIVTTLTLAGRFTGFYHPDCVFIDEAAQASEPETDIAIALLESEKLVVLAGDPKQLGPMVVGPASKLGLEIPLLQRLMEYPVYQRNSRTGTFDAKFITMLKDNFRSHPDILFIPNSLFYDNLLKPISQAATRDPLVTVAIYPAITKKLKPGRAIEFCSVSAKEKREGSSPSYFNLFEAKRVAAYVKTLCHIQLPKGHKVKPDQIGIVTPYKRQVHKIKQELEHIQITGVEVGTTEAFQGREKRVIIISTVRAQHSLLLHDRKYDLGFVNHDQRFNVAVTRAISKLIVIGCPLVLQRDNKWTEYINLCKEYGTYFGSNMETDNLTFKEGVVNRMQNVKFQDDQYNNSNV